MTKAAQGTFLGDYRIKQQVNACRLWPRGTLPDYYHGPVKSDLPALIVTGGLDPVTPPQWSKGLEANMPNALHITIPKTSHGTENAMPCLEPILMQFLETGSVKGLDASCAAEVKRPPFMTDIEQFMAFFKMP